ncbi:MAG: TlpA disulfide reductase family protein [Candidatus Binatia bacterium]
MTRAVGVALAIAVLVAGPARAGRLRVGDRLPAFALRDWQGRPLAASSLRGRVVCLDFWATWCPTCTTALPALDAVARRHPEATVLAVGVDDRLADGDRFVATRLPAPALTLARDPGGDLLARLGADGMPALWVVDRDGIVRLAVAAYTPERLEEVERLLAELARAAP